MRLNMPCTVPAQFWPCWSRALGEKLWPVRSAPPRLSRAMRSGASRRDGAMSPWSTRTRRRLSRLPWSSAPSTRSAIRPMHGACGGNRVEPGHLPCDLVLDLLFHRADIRIDRFSDFDPNVDPTACGCPPGSEIDFPVGPALMQSAPPPFHLFPTVQLYPGARSQDWRLFVGTANVVTDLDLGLPVTLGKWYGVQLDVDAVAATARSHITDLATGATLLDTRDLAIGVRCLGSRDRWGIQY